MMNEDAEFHQNTSDKLNTEKSVGNGSSDHAKVSFK